MLDVKKSTPSFFGFRGFCAETKQATSVETAEQQAPETQAPWTSTAIRDESVAYHKNMRISPRKLNDICRLVRGLSCEEAMIQMHLSDKPKAVFVEKAIKNAVTNGVNNFNMDASRLFVSEAIVGKGRYLKRLRRHAKGRIGTMFRYHAHLTIKVREQPYEEGEVRIGRRGRKIGVIAAEKELHNEVYAKYASVLEDFDIDD